MKKQHHEISHLSAFQTGLNQIGKLGIQVIPLTDSTVLSAAAIARQFGLLTNDAIIVAIMQASGLKSLASHDSDFDRVTGITRFGPV